MRRKYRLVEMAPPKFTDIEDEQLITEVRSYPCLYDQRDKDFRNTVVKACSWQNISEVIGRDVENCKRRWKDMRDNYFKIKRQNKKRPKWLLFPVLSFLEEVHHRERKPYHHLDTMEEKSLDEYPPNSIECSIEESPNSWSLEDGEEEDDHEINQSTDSNSRMRKRSVYPPPVGFSNGRYQEPQVDVIVRNRSDTQFALEPSAEQQEQTLPELPETDASLRQRTYTPFAHGHDRKRLATPATVTTNEKGVDAEEVDFLRSLAKTIKSVPPNLTANIKLSSTKKKEEEEDDVDSFMRSIAKTMKTMPPQKIAQAKIRILSIVTELQFATTSDKAAEVETGQGG